MTILADVNTGMSDSSAVEALMASMTGKPANGTPVQKVDDGNEADEDEEELDLDESEDQDEDEPDEDADEGDEDETDPADGDEPTPEVVVAPTADEAVVKVTVDGVESEVTVGSLKRLAGQEASLTKKSQEADVVGGRAAVMIQGALEGVAEDLAPYEDADWTMLAQEMEPEEFKWHRENFTRNQARYTKLVDAATKFESAVAERRATQFTAQIAEATTELTRDVPGWNDTLYGEVMAYAVKEGLDKGDVAQIANPKVLKLLLKAMKADKAGAVTAQKVNNAPARVKRSAGSQTIAEGVAKNKSVVEKRVLSGRGSDDDAIAMLVGRWK